MHSAGAAMMAEWVLNLETLGIEKPKPQPKPPVPQSLGFDLPKGPRMSKKESHMIKMQFKRE